MKTWIAIMLRIFITMPIWFYLFYKILVAVEATELMWFLYWIHVPASFLIAVLTEMAVRK
ncbi:MAG: hypothetical protein K0S79_109 [Nitrospira sp.]|nr:hypothetical protein [Nitrospira sp.]